MPIQTNRDACPGYFYASALAHSLVADFKKVPLSDKTRREEKLLAALDYGRLLLNICEPLVKGTPHDGAFAELYQELQNLARPWCDESKEHFIEDSRTGLILDCIYELQREVRDLNRRRKKTADDRTERGVAA